MWCPTFTIYICLFFIETNAQRSAIGPRISRRETTEDVICRRKPHFTCQNGECIPMINAKCDGVIHCQDLSDEKNCSNSNECILPEQPTGGSYQMNLCTENSCRVSPGIRVPVGSSLTYKCNAGYTPIGNLISFCYNNAWYMPPRCVKTCPALSSDSIDFDCIYNGAKVSCKDHIFPETKAIMACKYLYKIPLGNEPGYTELNCLDGGVWDRRSFNCIPECGKTVPSGILTIVKGYTPGLTGGFPWHVAIYRKINSVNFEQICGGSLVSPDLVISVAHCFYDHIMGKIEDASQYEVGAGKNHRDYNSTNDSHAQKSAIKTINLPERYAGSNTHYSADIALLRLAKRLNITPFVLPVCMDWHNEYINEHLSNGKFGKVMGWGVTAEQRLSSELQAITLPFINYQTCYNAAPEDFKGFLTSDKFCAGYSNGSSVCDGDSGGGLCFEHQGTWVLRGLVSISPVRDGSCDPNHYAAFTNVKFHMEWIRPSFELRHQPGPNIGLTIANSFIGCILPKQPTGGSFELGSCGEECNGAKAPIGSSLIYTWDKGHICTGNNVSVCSDNEWLPPLTCINEIGGKNCSALMISEAGDFECEYHNKTVSCQSAIAPLTKATLTCKNFYKLPLADGPGYGEIICLGNGAWSRPVLDCIPECGLEIPDETALTVNGSKIFHGRFPWYTLIYRIAPDGSASSIAAGTLISPNIVLALASSFYNATSQEASDSHDCVVVAGHYSGEYTTLGSYAQQSLIKRIDIATNYRGMWGRFINNAAIIYLKTPFTMTTLVRPICIDWENKVDKKQLPSKEDAKVYGGILEPTSTGGWESREAELIYIPRDECFPRVFSLGGEERFLQGDTFCVTCMNGSDSCRGNAFPTNIDYKFHGIWYLIGVGRLGSRKPDGSQYLGVYEHGQYLNRIRAALPTAF